MQTLEETKPNDRKRAWQRPIGIMAWLGLLAGGSFLVICFIAMVTEPSARSWAIVPFALLVSSILAFVALSGLVIIHAFRSWKNIRRLLFVLACLVTLVGLFYAEEDWRGISSWERHRRAEETKGEKFTIAALAPANVPDEKNFALTPLLKPMLAYTQGNTGLVWRDTNAEARLNQVSAELQPRRNTNDALVLGSLDKGTFADIRACAEFYRGNTNYPQADDPAAPAERILVALKKFDPELTELRDAAAMRPFSRFPIHYDYQPSWAILLPHLARMRAFTTLTHVHALAQLEAGRSQEAFSDLELGLRLSESIKDEPILIDHLVRIATMGIDLQTVREGLLRHAWTDAQLTQLEAQFSKIDLLSEYKLAMRGERALNTGGIDFLRRQGSRVKPSHFLANTDNSPIDGFSFLPSGWFYQNMLVIDRMHEEYLLPSVDERSHRIFPETIQKGEKALADLHAGPYTLIARKLLPALQKAVLRSAVMQTYIDATRIACAMERYRLANHSLPTTLDPLTPRFMDRIPNDVIDASSLRYAPDSKGGYMIYSVGWNQVDDHGVRAWSKEKKNSRVDPLAGDWVWQMASR